ncbi:MAG: TRIC cation channel family protein, partial [Geminicoccaceae bacterium]|nr:TRIC cation channel family protein [Geminicoccaceae bacterium]
MNLLLATLDLAGVFVFAVSGALTASRKELDIVGFAFVATVTGLGGGTLRDLLLDVGPVFWVHKPHYLLVTTIAAVLV